jgi:signal transduction histidine kinase
VTEWRTASYSHRVELMAVVAPLLVVIGLQCVSLERESRLGVLVHDSQVRDYLDSVSSLVQQRYRDNVDRMLAIGSEDLIEHRFDAINRHLIDSSDPTIKQAFVGVLEECSCKTQYFDRHRRALSLDTDAATRAAVLRVTVPWRLQQRQILTDRGLLVDEQDPNNRVVYRLVTDDADRIIGVAGVVIDSGYFVSVVAPLMVRQQLDRLPQNLRDNLVVSLHARSGQELFSTDRNGRDDAITEPFAFIFSDLRVSARSRQATARQLAVWHFATRVSISLLMGLVVLAAAVITIRTKRHAARLSQLKTEFVSNVTHELRTPLASIALMGESLRLSRVISAAKVQEYGGRIETESLRLRRSITNVLNIARIESGQRRYSREPLSVEDVVQQALRIVELPLSQKGFVLDYDRALTGLASIEGDGEAVAEAIVNLIDNAVKYSRTSNVIQLRVEQRDGWVAISIADQGTGIAMTDQARIFDAYQRAGGDSVERISGTGLGLAIIKHTVEAHHGRVVVASQLGVGSTFTLLFPCIAADASAARRCRTPVSEPPPPRVGDLTDVTIA